MKKWFCFIVIACLSVVLFSCHDNSKKYRNVLEEGSWYVYDINYSYQLHRKYETPELVDFIHYMLEEQNLLFLPGDELVFSGKRVSVRCLNQDAFTYDYFYNGNYIQVEDYKLRPDGDQDDFSLTFDERSLEDFLEFLSVQDESYQYFLEDMEANLRSFHITYQLQRPIPIVAQVISDIYVGPLYNDGTNLLYEDAALNLFWDKGMMNLSMDDKVYLENGPQFFIQITDLQIKEGFTPGSYDFAGGQTIKDPRYGTIQINIVDAHFNANNTVSVDFEIIWNDMNYTLNYRKGIRQWKIRDTRMGIPEKNIVLSPDSKIKK